MSDDFWLGDRPVNRFDSCAVRPLPARPLALGVADAPERLAWESSSRPCEYFLLRYLPRRALSGPPIASITAATTTQGR
jgi:hypothetical protein